MSLKRLTTGFTLTELVIIVLLLGIAALVAIPSLSSTEAQKLEVAAQEVAGAIRFARIEAMRIGSDVTAMGGANIVGVDIGNIANNLGTGSGAGATVNHVGVFTYSALTRQPYLAHPIDKKAFDIDIRNAPFTAGVEIASITFINTVGIVIPGTMFGFNGDGMPYQFANGGIFLLKAPLISGRVELSYAGKIKVITIDGNGRVEVL